MTDETNGASEPKPQTHPQGHPQMPSQAQTPEHSQVYLQSAPNPQSGAAGLGNTGHGLLGDDLPQDAPGDSPDGASGGDLRWVWREVRKRVFIKLPFSLGVAEALQATIPIVLDESNFVVGLSSRDYPLSANLLSENVRNTIEGILRQASRQYIHFEVIEGTTIEEWHEVKRRRARAQEAVIAMSEKKGEEHHYEDLLNQIIGEIRQRITATRDRALPPVRASLILDVVPSLGDATEMLFHDPDTHEARRIMARAMDRVAGFLDVPVIQLALEVERYRREQKPSRNKGPVIAVANNAANSSNSDAIPTPTEAPETDAVKTP
jgi:hypothetical protein